MNIRAQVDPQAARSTFPTERLTMDLFLERIVGAYRRSFDLHIPECHKDAVEALRDEFRSLRIPLTQRQAEQLLS